MLNGLLGEMFERCDAILTPPAPGQAPLGLGATGNPVFCTIWTLCGTPAVTLPLMKGADGMPLGVQLVGPKGDDARLLRTAKVAGVPTRRVSYQDANSAVVRTWLPRLRLGIGPASCIVHQIHQREALTMSRSVAFIGTGIMGKPMVLNLLKAGHSVAVHIRSKPPLEELGERWRGCLRVRIRGGLESRRHHHLSSRFPGRRAGRPGRGGRHRRSGGWVYCSST